MLCLLNCNMSTIFGLQVANPATLKFLFLLTINYNKGEVYNILGINYRNEMIDSELFI